MPKFIPMNITYINKEVELTHKTKKGKNIVSNSGRLWNLICYMKDVACLKDEPGYLLTAMTLKIEGKKWQGMWVKENDKDLGIKIL